MSYHPVAHILLSCCPVVMFFILLSCCPVVHPVVLLPTSCCLAFICLSSKSNRPIRLNLTSIIIPKLAIVRRICVSCSLWNWRDVSHHSRSPSTIFTASELLHIQQLSIHPQLIIIMHNMKIVSAIFFSNPTIHVYTPETNLCIVVGRWPGSC